MTYTLTYTLRICYADKIRPPCRKIELLKVKQALQACRPRMNTPRKRLQKPEPGHVVYDCLYSYQRTVGVEFVMSNILAFHPKRRHLHIMEWWCIYTAPL